MTLHVERSGRPGGTPLVLLHGMGATGETFAPLLRVAADRWPGPCVVVDLPGHGRSPWSPAYDVATACATVADAVPELPGAVVVGHSLGGVLAMALAGTHELRAAVAASVKALWSDDEVARARALAGRPRSRFTTEQEAGDRFLAVAGLRGVADWPALRASGTTRDGDAWVLAQDPATNAFVAPDVPALLAAARCPVTTATGSDDPMAPPSVLHAVAPGGPVVAGAGHNLHVEAPGAVLDLALAHL